MEKIKLQKIRRIRRKRVIRKNIYGISKRPRLSVFKSNKYIYVQAIDDDKGNTIVSATSLTYDKKNRKMNIEISKKVGEEIGKKLLEKKIKSVFFDRNGFIYTGRIKALADGVRQAGVKF